MFSCDRNVYLPTSNTSNRDKSIFYQTIIRPDGINAPWYTTSEVIDRSPNLSAIFIPRDLPPGNEVDIVEFAPDYDWIIFSSIYLGKEFLSVTSKTPNNLVAIQRDLNLARERCLTSYDLVLQNAEVCNCDEAFAILKNKRESAK